MEFKLWLEDYEYDELGVRVKDVPCCGKVDAGIADILQKINDAGFKTVQSMSGLKADYERAKDRYSPNGYIAFFKSDNTPENLKKVIEAPSDRFDEYLKIRDKILADLKRRYGGLIDDDRKIMRMWEDFARELLR